jgi:hypothetical protein
MGSRYLEGQTLTVCCPNLHTHIFTKCHSCESGNPEEWIPAPDRGRGYALAGVTASFYLGNSPLRFDPSISYFRMI